MSLHGIVKVYGLAATAFVTAFAFTPVLTHFLYKYKLGKSIRTADEGAPIMGAMHAAKSGTPTMGGILIWGTVVLLALVFHYGARLSDAVAGFDFYSRAQTLLPLGVLVMSAMVGLVDDYLNVRRIGGGKGGGLRVRHRLALYAIIAAVGAAWFYWKLDWDLLRIPFVGSFNIGWWYIPFFMLVIVATANAVNFTDGLDGLAGGLLASSFSAYAVISLMLGKTELAAFCAAIVGALLAFLWFNINPARFFMGDTGAMSLGVTLGVVAMLTNTSFLLIIIGLVFVLEAASVLLQMTSKRLFKRKIFRSAPFHHHLEAIGWPEPKVVMRLWVIGMIASTVGLTLALLDLGIYK